MSALNQAFLRAYTKDTRGARQTGSPPANSPPANSPPANSPTFGSASSRHASPLGDAVRHEPEQQIPEPHISVTKHTSRIDSAEPVEAARITAASPPSFDAAFDSPDQIALAAAFGAIHNVTAVDHLGDWTSLADVLNNHLAESQVIEAPAYDSRATAPIRPAPDMREAHEAAPTHAAAASSPAASPTFAVEAPAATAPAATAPNPPRRPEPEPAAAVAHHAHKPDGPHVAPTPQVIPPPQPATNSQAAAMVADNADTEPSLATAAPTNSDTHTESHVDSHASSTGDPRLESRLQRVTASRPVFVAAWEVDAFQWPTGCDELLESCHDEFHLAAARFRTATIEGLRVLAVTSLLRREGRSTVAMALARAAAMEGIRVALLDADLDHPNLGSALGFQASVGWPDVLRENIPLAEAAVNSLADRLTLFPLANPPRRWPMALNTPEVSRLLRDLGQTFELVIVDLGPLAGPASRGFEVGESCPVDAALLVQDVRITTSDQARISAQGLRHAGIGAVGIIENFAAPLTATHDD